MINKAALLILDGWGIGKTQSSDAIASANTPIMDRLMRDFPNATLTTFGDQVGLPHGQMGNSEVGHMNIGAGRIVYQDLLMIGNDMDSGAFAQKQEVKSMFSNAKASGGKFHLIGLLSDGGVHSHVEHLYKLLNLATEFDLPQTYIHAFLDGRDTDPNGGLEYLSNLLVHLEGKNAKLATVIGRYFAMDRDHRWERTAKAYNLLVYGVGESSDDILATIKSRYADGQTDEFVESILLDKNGLIEEGDTVLFYNFRSDRPRQITEMLSINNFPEVQTKALPLHFYSMTPYDATFDKVKVLYTKKPLEKTFGELIESNNLSQLRMAETEKYPHVTYFFSGGQERAYNGESRIMVDSPKVATYDLKPSMSAHELTDALLTELDLSQPDFICLNFANTDMVGHTGVFEAAIEAAETVDACVSKILEKLLPLNYHVIIIADHGNSDMMINDDGSPNTAHTVNPVPIVYVAERPVGQNLSDGILADVAPTLASILGIKKFDEMTGKNLIT